MVMPGEYDSPYSFTCQDCEGNLSTVTFHCPCGKFGMYECEQDDGWTIYLSNSQVFCPVCHSQLSERQAPDHVEEEKVPGFPNGECAKCGESVDSHPKEKCSAGWFKDKEGKWAFG